MFDKTISNSPARPPEVQMYFMTKTNKRTPLFFVRKYYTSAVDKNNMNKS